MSSDTTLKIRYLRQTVDEEGHSNVICSYSQTELLLFVNPLRTGNQNLCSLERKASMKG